MSAQTRPEMRQLNHTREFRLRVCKVERRDCDLVLTEQCPACQIVVPHGFRDLEMRTGLAVCRVGTQLLRQRVVLDVLIDFLGAGVGGHE